MFVLFFFELKATSASGEHWSLIVGDDDDDKESELKHRRDIISHHHLSLIYFQIMPWIFFFRYFLVDGIVVEMKKIDVETLCLILRTEFDQLKTLNLPD